MTPKQALKEALRNEICAGDGDEDALIERLADCGFVIVPIKPTDDMLEELARIGDGPLISGAEVWGYMLAAATAQASINSEN